MENKLPEVRKITIPLAEYEHMKAQLQYLMEQLKLTKRRLFGASSEKSEYDQINLFNEAEVFCEPLAAEPALTEVARHYRKKQRLVNGELPEGIPVEVVEHKLPDSEQSCPVCEEALHVMGKEVVRRDLKLIPAKAVIVEHVQYTYSCRNCEKNDISVSVVKAPTPAPVIKGSFAAPETVAHLMVQKFVMGVPLYRQEQEWKRQGIMLNRQTMCNWLIRCAEEWLEPVYGALRKKLLLRDVLHADETVLQVLREPGKAAQSKSYMWVYRTSGDAEHPIILLEYQPGRKAEYPKAFLEGWSGYLHTDGYDAYHKLPEDVVVVGCWAHARRRFDAALKALPQKARENSGPLIGKRYCDKLFAIERELASLSFEERVKKRRELAKPVLDEFLQWMKSLGDIAKNAFGNAVSYTLNQWEYLERYLLDGRLEISNNRAERSVKSFVIDRKNFLFAVTPAGATASAIIFSICETAKENGLNPYEYLSFLFRALPNNTDTSIEEFLPGGNSIPDSCLFPNTKHTASSPVWDDDV